MRSIYNKFSLLLFLWPIALPAQKTSYFPPRGEAWEQRTPEALGFDAARLAEAVRFAQDNEYAGERDLRLAILKAFAREPNHTLAGPTRPRGGPAGMIVKNGYLVAHWGDLKRVDMTFSVTKSYLSTVAGLAWDEGLIQSLDERVADYVWDGTFDGEHNAKITWNHLLNQSSDWSGALFGIPDWTDRPPAQGGIDEWKYRPLREPGSHYQYNDVRVNVLAYALLQIWRQPLPAVLREKIMDPIGASTTWRWYGYDNAYTPIDGVSTQSVSGGGHFGGGLFISTLDQARFGLLFLRQGRWKGRQLLSRAWIERARRPSPANPDYGYMWWLLGANQRWVGVPDSVYYAAGFGGNFIVVDEENDLLMVLRWLDPPKLGEMVSRVVAALEK
jgi:CubicO group peptidase (beta-lactamase class C family)